MSYQQQKCTGSNYTEILHYTQNIMLYLKWCQGFPSFHFHSLIPAVDLTTMLGCQSCNFIAHLQTFYVSSQYSLHLHWWHTSHYRAGCDWGGLYTYRYVSWGQLETTWSQSSIVSCVKSHVSRQNYFRWIAKFDEGILNHGQAVTSGKFSVLTLNSDHDLWKANSDIWHRRWTAVPNFTKIELLLFEKTQWASSMN